MRDSRRPGSSTSPSNSKGQRLIGFKAFVGLVLLLVVLGIVRSAIAGWTDLRSMRHITLPPAFLM